MVGTCRKRDQSTLVKKREKKIATNALLDRPTHGDHDHGGIRVHIGYIHSHTPPTTPAGTHSTAVTVSAAYWLVRVPVGSPGSSWMPGLIRRHCAGEDVLRAETCMSYTLSADGPGTVSIYPSLGSTASTLSGSIGWPAIPRVSIPGKPVSVTATTPSNGGVASAEDSSAAAGSVA